MIYRSALIPENTDSSPARARLSSSLQRFTCFLECPWAYLALIGHLFIEQGERMGQISPRGHYNDNVTHIHEENISS